MKKIIYLVVAGMLVYAYVQKQGISIPGLPDSGPSSIAQSSGSNVKQAIESRQSDVQVQGEGVVTNILRDDLRGSRHQKFILRINKQDTLLVVHNIDLAPRIDKLKTGDTVAFFGEYEWNSKGGLVHWTHHDPNGRHVAGWLKHDGQTYQ